MQHVQLGRLWSQFTMHAVLAGPPYSPRLWGSASYQRGAATHRMVSDVLLQLAHRHASRDADQGRAACAMPAHSMQGAGLAAVAWPLRLARAGVPREPGSPAPDALLEGLRNQELQTAARAHPAFSMRCPLGSFNIPVKMTSVACNHSSAL